MITRHAEKRLRKRAGLPKKAIERNFATALGEGKRQVHFKGAFRKYLDFWATDYHSTPIVHGNTIYFMKGSDFVTAWEVPQKYRKYLKG
ncbi:MAG TPA: hypothetical protein VFL85_04960 [Candidatus Saccharimonadales bacterium]|nr:hypothetical protein [Candidatus Saccharimonadales bacterium]